jgi:hypothetical protein
MKPKIHVFLVYLLRRALEVLVHLNGRRQQPHCNWRKKEIFLKLKTKKCAFKFYTKQCFLKIDFCTKVKNTTRDCQRSVDDKIYHLARRGILFG